MSYFPCIIILHNGKKFTIPNLKSLDMNDKRCHYHRHYGVIIHSLALVVASLTKRDKYSSNIPNFYEKKNF